MASTFIKVSKEQYEKYVAMKIWQVLSDPVPWGIMQDATTRILSISQVAKVKPREYKVVILGYYKPVTKNPNKHES